MPELADRLRTALTLARVDPRVREHLRTVVDDPKQLEPIVRELGVRHGLVRDLLRVTGRMLDLAVLEKRTPQSIAERAARLRAAVRRGPPRERTPLVYELLDEEPSAAGYGS